MRSQFIFRLFFCGRVLALTLILAFGAVAGASASNGPIRTVYPTDSVGLSPLLTTVCGFPVARRLTGSMVTLVWLDAQGQPVRTTYTFPQAKIELSANGHVMTASAAGPGFETYNPDGSVTVVSVGTAHFATAPGSGVVFGIAGRLVQVLDANGDMMYTDFEVGINSDTDLAKACAYLAS